MERTFIMIKPDGVQRGLIGQIISRFESKGYVLVGMKMKTANEQLLHKHYAEHVGKVFFDKLVKYIMSGPVVPMVWQGKDAVAAGRKLLGTTKPLQSPPGTIRGDFCIQSGRNLIHGSDSVDSAKREIELWFNQDELNTWKNHSHEWVYE